MALPPRAARALSDLELFGINFGLDRTRRLLAELGSPQLDLPVVLVAGTNGKGSVAANLASIGRAAGYRTALYTSPHLEEVEERLRIDGQPVDSERLGEHLLATIAAAERVLAGPPTYFEAITAAAFREMATAEVELAVVEVGLGGRLDATNTAEPLLSLITPISLEHRDWLGDTPAAIAREKAGILRSGRPAIAWGSPPEARRQLSDVATEVGADLVFGDERTTIRDRRRHDWQGQSFTVTTPQHTYRLTTPLLGAHQIDNAAHAVLAAETLAANGWPRIAPDAITHGIAQVSWPGRLEVVDLPPGAGPTRALLDAGHNPDAAQRVADFICSVSTSDQNDVDLLVGLLADKDAESILAPLAAVARETVLTLPPHSRGRAPRELASLLPNAHVEPELDKALDRALALGGDTLLICGSFFLVGAARRLLRDRFGVPAR